MLTWFLKKKLKKLTTWRQQGSKNIPIFKGFFKSNFEDHITVIFFLKLHQLRMILIIFQLQIYLKYTNNNIQA